MRAIKFRAWDKGHRYFINLEHKNGLLYSWGEFYLSDGWDGEDNPTFDGRKTTGFELTQYTGLKDKNGKEIYEGDILDCGVIEWNEVECRFELTHPRSVFEPNTLHKDHYGNVEIIGNIYENGELLNVKTETKG